MSIAGPFINLDYDAEPSITTVDGAEVASYPPLAGLFYITDAATFAAHQAALGAHVVTPAHVQNVLAGVDTITLHFADEATAGAVVEPINALPPIPAPPPAAEAAEVPEVLTADMRQVRLKLLSEPAGEGTRLDVVEGFVATQPPAVQIEWQYARELRRDHPLVAVMGLSFGLDAAALDAWFIEARAIGPTLSL